VHALAETKSHVDYLQSTPMLSSCSESVLAEFIHYGQSELHVSAGDHVDPSEDAVRSTYVLMSGSALLATHDVVITLEAGDYFGGDQASRFHLGATVVALNDLIFLTLTPADVEQLRQASSRDLHPSKVDWRNDYPIRPRQRTVSQDRSASMAHH